MKNCNDPNLGDVLCKFTSFYSPNSELYLLNGFEQSMLNTAKMTRIITLYIKAVSSYFLCSCHKHSTLVIDEFIIFNIMIIFVLQLSYSLFNFIIA